MILAWLLHSVYATVIAYVLAHLFGSLSPTISAISLALGAILGLRQARKLRDVFPDWKLLAFHPGASGAMEIALTIFVLYAAGRHFLWMLFPMDFNWATLSQTNFGDLPLHINFLRAFANGVPFPPHNPIYASELLRYPYGCDLYNALWESVGVRLPAHLTAVGWLATGAALIALRSFAGWWGIGAFFLGGGLSTWQTLTAQRWIDEQSQLQWKNLFLAVFITQRGFLFALPLGILLLLATRRHFLVKPLTRGQLVGLGFIWGTLPLFHLHAFVIISLMMAGVAIEAGGWQALRRLLTSPMALVAYLPATFFVLFSTKFLGSAGIARWSWGWTFNSLEGFVPIAHAVLRNFGYWLVVPPAIALCLWTAPKDQFDERTRRRLWIEFAVYAGLFTLFFNLILAPWDWDNIKLLVWPYLGFARLLWLVIEPRLKGLWGGVERVLVACLLCLSGFNAIMWTLQAPPGRATPIYSFGDLAYAEGALARVPPDAVFASAPSHQHPLTYFGRLRAAGYDGHLWSHGIDARATQAKIERIMKGDPDSIQLAKEIGITHIFWGPDERVLYGSETPAWSKTLENVSRVPGYEVYAVK